MKRFFVITIFSISFVLAPLRGFSQLKYNSLADRIPEFSPKNSSGFFPLYTNKSFVSAYFCKPYFNIPIQFYEFSSSYFFENNFHLDAFLSSNNSPALKNHHFNLALGNRFKDLRFKVAFGIEQNQLIDHSPIYNFNSSLYLLYTHKNYEIGLANLFFINSNINNSSYLKLLYNYKLGKNSKLGFFSIWPNLNPSFFTLNFTHKLNQNLEFALSTSALSLDFFASIAFQTKKGIRVFCSIGSSKNFYLIQENALLYNFK